MATAYPYVIPREMYREQRQRLAGSMSKAGFDATHAAVFQGGSEVPVNSTDTSYLFRQESYFEYLFGHTAPDCFGAVLADGTSILFLPNLPISYAVWMGPLPTTEGVKSETQVDEVYFVSQLVEVLQTKGIKTVHVLNGVNSDSGLNVLEASFEGRDKFTVAKDFLFTTLTTQRVFKTKHEAQLLQYINGISSAAHVAVMQHCKVGMSQHQLESLFLHNVYYHGGCRHVSYQCICATGGDAAVLHYVRNDKTATDDTMALLDMGGEYCCYASDITCCFPINGKFNEKQALIYNTVLAAHDAVMTHAKPGVSWVDMHLLALRVMCEHLVKATILIGTVEELMEKKIMRLFQAHGLGHLIGMDVHDVGGYMEGCPPRPTAVDCCKLRTARVLEEGLYITIEPGCYFNHVLLTEAFANAELKPHLNEPLIREFWNFGGVRIESNVMITKEGVENYTRVPRTVSEIEETMSGKSFSKEITNYQN